MFIAKNLAVNEKNHLTVGGIDTVELAEKYGTPLYVMDENLIRENCRLYKSSIDKNYDGNGLALYASKAFSSLSIYKIVNEEGLGIDVVSGGELYTALKADFPAQKIYFHGNNKTKDELKMALDNGVGRIVVDNLTELSVLNELALSENKTVDILFRIKPGIDAHTHSFVMTGQIDSKFGVALETGEAFDIIKTASEMQGINVVGIHCHIGSQIFDLKPFEQAADVMMTFMAKIKSELKIELSELNLGGGFGISYTESDTPIEYDKYMEAVSKIVKASALKYDLKLPKIIMEPGRSIVASAGTTLYTIGSVKEIPNIRKYVAVDGGMADNPRYILYQSEYDFQIANKAGDAKTETVTIAGRCCESGDLLGENVKLQNAGAGDILAVLATGAYNYSMASHYNRLPNPAVIMIKDGKERVVIKRESYEDLIKNDLF
ncbi:MAG: diaminopimelate decarboxylase [Clostridia bacterium]|nr:diaminopimelate decarboxylase [Clostridia bacterium]